MTQNNGISDSEMPLIEHLKELRDRFVRAALAMAICMLVCFFFYKEIWGFLVGPIIDALHDTQRGELAQLRLLEGIINQLKVAALAGFFCASPIVFYQFWQFIAPALYPKEKHFLLPLALASTVLFLIGSSFGYFVIFDFIFPFLLTVSPEDVKATISIDDALGTTTKLLLGFGLCFQLPVIAFFLGRGGLIDHKDMTQFFRYAVVGIFVIAAFLTPPDPISQFLMAVPLLSLYGFSIIIVWLTHKKGTEPEL
ncbi:MAG: twin-arginine translocase subunit TatC [Myxococcota bacterium]|nr:twin-arginine translocase subunit TatC [Myxococcota bacterium]